MLVTISNKAAVLQLLQVIDFYKGSTPQLLKCISQGSLCMCCSSELQHAPLAGGAAHLRVLIQHSQRRGWDWAVAHVILHRTKATY